jgi:2,4-dienoyl-CoA reductase-like NADH-dependent reductase (Old Yellow Enzyme family)
MTGAVGLIETREQMADILANNRADLVFMAREFLRDARWPLRAARELKQSMSWPPQYLRAAPPDSTGRKPLESDTNKAKSGK